MKPRSKLQFSAAVLCILAMLALQSFGALRGYLCLCADKAVATQSADCCLSHGAGCEANQTAPNSGDHSPCDRQQHLPLPSDVAARVAEAPLTLVAPLIAILPLPETLRAPAPSAVGPACAWTDREPPPPIGIAVARTTVLLI